MKRILVDAERCAGCRYCEMICSFSHEGRFSPSLSRITVIKEDRFGFDYPILCRLCDACPPVDACPSKALKRSPDGTLRLDEEGCSGCGICVKACPHSALKIGGSSRPICCDLCGGKPLCVERCPTGALTYQEAEEFDERPMEALRRLMERWGIHG